jgi:hypothetical protein
VEGLKDLEGENGLRKCDSGRKESSEEKLLIIMKDIITVTKLDKRFVNAVDMDGCQFPWSRRGRTRRPMMSEIDD